MKLSNFDYYGFRWITLVWEIESEEGGGFSRTETALADSD